MQGGPPTNCGTHRVNCRYMIISRNIRQKLMSYLFMKFSFIQLIRFLGDNTRAGPHAGIFKGGWGWNFEKNNLLSLKYRLPYLLKHLCHTCYFDFNTSTLFLTRSSLDVCFSLPVFARYSNFVNLLKYNAM